MKKKGIVYRRMLLSFVAAFILPIFIMCIFYFFSSHVIEKQMEKSNDNLLRTIQSVCDEEIDIYENVLQWYTYNENVRSLGSLKKTDGTEYTIYHQLSTDVRDSFSQLSRMGNCVKDVFLYFPQIERTISARDGVLRLKVYLEQHSSDEEAAKQLSNFLHTGADGTQYIGKSDLLGNNLMLYTKLCWRNDPDCGAMLCMWVDVSALSQKIASMDWQYGFEWAILDSQQHVIKPAENIADEDVLKYASGQGDSEDYIVSSTISDDSGWQYVILVPRSVVDTAANPIRWFFAVSIIFCVLIGVAITMKFTDINYTPIDRTMQLLKRNNVDSAEVDTVKPENEYRYIQRQVERLVDSKKELERSVSNSEKKERNWVLTNLLMKPDAGMDAVAVKWKPMVERFYRGENKVVLIQEAVRSSNTGSCVLTGPLKQFAVENILTELLSEQFICQLVNIEGNQAMIVHASSFTGKEEDALREILLDFQAILQEKFNFHVAITVGSKHEGLNGIHASYLETREAEEFLATLEQDYIDFEDIRDNALRKYGYSMQSEELVYAAIQNDNPELATAFISKILEEAFGRNIRSNIRRAMVTDIYCTLLKVADEKGRMDKIPVEMNRLDGKQNLEELKQNFAKIVESICEGKQTVAEESPNAELCRKVLQYIRENYSDPDLNVSKAAMEFRLSPSTLSSVYKKETGNSLLKIINGTKIDAAAGFLREGYSVADTAQKVGIIDSSSFIRLFKKHMGITPGQYKTNFYDERT